MSFIATILFKDAGINFIPVWLQTVALNFPMAFFWQMCYAGPFVRFIFKLGFSGQGHVREADPEAYASGFLPLSLI